MTATIPRPHPRPVAGACRAVQQCLLCGSGSLVRYLDLGPQPPSDAFRTDPHGPQVYYPLAVLLCQACGLSQLSQLVDPAILFQQDYPYESSTTATGRAHFAALARDVVARFAPAPGALAVDIGSNVGVLVDAFAGQGMRALGVDSAPNIAAQAVRLGRPTRCEFFTPATARAIAAAHGPAAVITGTNVFAHLHDPGAFLDAVDTLLAPTGVLVIESPWFLRLVAGLEYDTIYHEHAFYLALGPLAHFAVQRGFRVFDVQPTGIHGGSLRVFIGRPGAWPMQPSVSLTLLQERDAGITVLPVLEDFAATVRAHRQALLRRLWQEQRMGNRVAAIGAPAKGMTLLNTCGIGPDELCFVTDKSPLKIGKWTPGPPLVVRDDAALVEEGINVGLLLAWNFAPEILANLSAWRLWGGKALLPLPSPHMVRGTG